MPAAKKCAPFVLLIRHPNHSGFQKDPLQGYFIPPHYISSIAIRQGGAPVLRVDGAISLSENPTIRFDYGPKGSGGLDVEAQDSEGNRFAQSWPMDELRIGAKSRHTD
ncbi:MAG: hypothetical protein HC850_18430 [Rhodomicrobium sp.]|nr:hypothetical protein [Rhodomicrobium sp.]